MSKNIPHDNRLIVLKTGENSIKLESGLYTGAQQRNWQEGTVVAVGVGDYAKEAFKPMDKIMYFNPIDVIVDGKIMHLVDCASVLMYLETEDDLSKRVTADPRS